MRYCTFISWVVAYVLLVPGWGCSSPDAGSERSSSAVSGAGGSDGASAGTALGTGGDGCLFNCNATSSGSGSGGNGDGVTIVLSPADPELLVVNGAVPTQDFTATLNGADITSEVTWLYERPEVGDIASGSTFTPTGLVGGVGNLTARWHNAEGKTTVSVYIKKTVDAVGLTPAEIDELDNPSGGPDNVLTLLYPEDRTVFPLGVLAPEVQWGGGMVGDLYRLRLAEKYYEYTGYFLANPPSRHLMAEADWANVESSGAGAESDPLQVTLTRMSGMVAFEPKAQTWHIAQGRLRGSVYYWELPGVCGGNANGRIVRIKADSPVVDEFFQPGTCFGCHTVSRDGKKMAAEFQDGNGPLYTLDLAASPVGYGAINAGNPAGDFIFSAFNETGDKLLASDNSAFNPATMPLKIVDATTGQILNDNAMGLGCGEPAWSPDGKKIAGICGYGGGGWSFDANQGHLAVADVAPDGFTVSNVTTIVPQQQPGVPGVQGRPAYPSFSPGSEWIAFGRPTAGARSVANGNLWMVASDGSQLKHLARASGENRSFNPVFAPLRAGGYFWLVYVSKRNYGNTLMGANRQQLWVTAISDPPTANDPSHPSFYMRGQEICGKSENAYYALDPCKDLGAGCVSGVDCCNGQCIKDPDTNQYVCGEPPPPGQCSEDGNGCESHADCCNFPSVKCIDGYCQHPPPP